MYSRSGIYFLLLNNGYASLFRQQALHYFHRVLFHSYILSCKSKVISTYRQIHIYKFLWGESEILSIAQSPIADNQYSSNTNSNSPLLLPLTPSTPIQPVPPQ